MNNSKLESLLRVDRSFIPSDGGSEYNRLIFAKSPYLLQHAENPVDWREWGEAAFAEARSRDLPLFISIGYATCHWCHVMAEESFSDKGVAALLNELFIPIKVDREERPDIDEFYMTASRALTGGGGWPLNVFIDHERRPFFTITYLPKYAKHKAPGFMDLLKNLFSIWKDKREILLSNCAEISRSMSALTTLPESTCRSLDSLSKEAVNYLQEIFDDKHGGFGLAVKFPMPTYLLFLLSRDSHKYPAAHPMAIKTLENIKKGGIHDQLGGGFHRYSVDRQWLVPHFEKMLYDQAMLIIAFCAAFTLSKEQKFLETAIKTARFACNELLNTEGGFCSGLDADSEGEEGLFYTWPYDELSSTAGVDCQLALDFWSARREGDLDGRCILHQTDDPEEIVLYKNTDRKELQLILSTASKRLLEFRELRERPLLDPKVICSWNALMITALIRLYSASNNSEWLETAGKTAHFMLAKMVNSEGILARNWLEEASAVPAFAEDYAALTAALIDLSTNSKNPVWPEKLDFFANELKRLFISENGEVSYCGADAEQMPLDIPAVQDGVLPSTVALCAITLIRLGRIKGNDSFIETGRKIIGRYRGITEKNPAACLSLLMAEEELVEMI